MKTLIIHPEDESTNFLKEIYEGKGWTVLSDDKSLRKRNLKKMLLEHDRIIMLGHGYHGGLYGFGRVVLDSTFVYILREKALVCIWCNADKFVSKYDLNGLYTGMIISDSDEADMFLNLEYSVSDIKTSNELFASSIKNSIEILDTRIVENVLSDYNLDNPIVNFNKDKIYFV